MSKEDEIWIGTRQLVDETNQLDSVTVRLGRPEKVADENWRCLLELDGLTADMRRSVHGVDAIQALQNALEAVATAIRESGRVLTWYGGEPGDAGFRRAVPTYLGPQFASDIEALIEREVLKRITSFSPPQKTDTGKKSISGAGVERHLRGELGEETMSNWRPVLSAIDDPIAVDTWRYEFDGGVRESRIEIGRPQPIPGDKNGDWFCPVLFEHVTSGVKCVFGVGPVDTLANAMAFVRQQSSRFEKVEPRTASTP